MSKIIDFYFDFISPYSYIAYKKIKSMQNKNGIDFNYKPILLGGLHKLGNITAPAERLLCINYSPVPVRFNCLGYRVRIYSISILEFFPCPIHLLH